MTPQPGRSMSATRKNEMAKAIGRIKSTDRLPWVHSPLSTSFCRMCMYEPINAASQDAPKVKTRIKSGWSKRPNISVEFSA